MSLSILTYAIFTGLCGFATQAWQIAVLRFISSLGMGGEWALGVALVTELWPDRSRALLAGLIGAAANVGFLAVAIVSLVLVKLIHGVGNLLLAMGISHRVVGSLLHGDGWRLMMMVGALPALLVFLIMWYVPESHKWEAERDRGGTSHWATRDLFGVVLGAIGAAAVVVLWSPVFYSFVRQVASGDSATLGLPAWGKALRGLGSVVGLVVALVGFIYPVVRYLARAEAAGAGRRGSPPMCGTFALRRQPGRCCAFRHVGIGAMGSQVVDRTREAVTSKWWPLSC